MIVNVSDAVAALGTTSMTRRRFADGGYSTAAGSKGTFVPGASTDTTILGSVGPVSGRTRQMLPEGIRLSARYLLHTTADVRGDSPATSGAITQADSIIFDGRTYQVYDDKAWTSHGQYRRLVLVDASAEP